MDKYIAEFLGTFFLVLTIVLTVNNGTGNLAPLAIGTVLMGVIYAWGHISKAHYNPAVTIGIWLRGKCQTKDVLPYIIAQILAAILASFIAPILLLSIDGASLPTNLESLNTIPAIIAEFLGTFVLVSVILNVAFTKSSEGNSYYGFAIGFTVTGLAYTLGPVSGGAFNPAVAIGMSLAHMSIWGDIWIYFVGAFLGAIAAAFAFRVYYGDRE